MMSATGDSGKYRGALRHPPSGRRRQLRHESRADRANRASCLDVNEKSYSGSLARIWYRAILRTRFLGPRPTCHAIGAARAGEAIERIYVINLDRHSDRWDRMCGEFNRLMDNKGRPATTLARRFRAIDARDGLTPLDSRRVKSSYSLADQLFVEPHPILGDRFDAESWRVEMTRQEIAVALSHVAVWEQVAEGDYAYSLVLEDDVYFRRGFCRDLDEAWSDLVGRHGGDAAFDLLYVSYQEARTGKRWVPVSHSVFKPFAGLWQLSGYVVSRSGARKLLDALPVRGPVDTWINRHFESIDVFATRRSIVQQRADCESANLYSILPVLSQVGLMTREKPLLARKRPKPAPVFALGEQHSGLTALAMALSMLGYRCCSDLVELPTSESEKLFGNRRGRIFDAYVNIGSLAAGQYIELARTYAASRFIITVDAKHDNGSLGDHNDELRLLAEELREISSSVLILPRQHTDKWEALCGFLCCDYPSDPYPHCEDCGQRALAQRDRHGPFAANDLRSDPSPWIAASKSWHGLSVAAAEADSAEESLEHRFTGLDSSLWAVRDDTFPSNLALFTPQNFTLSADQTVRLKIQKERTPVREFTSAALCSRRQYLYGRFVADVRPASAPGLITGIFLHRNSPRQEIDIEFVGKDTHKMLVNVFYNPGLEGSRMEYGYRGTPTFIDLGFDASEDFHRYEIEWCPTAIRWSVDGRLVYERLIWDPTPIPHLPMQLHFNLWHSRSRELAGRLNLSHLPATAELRALDVYSRHRLAGAPHPHESTSDMPRVGR